MSNCLRVIVANVDGIILHSDDVLSFGRTGSSDPVADIIITDHDDISGEDTKDVIQTALRKFMNSPSLRCDAVPLYRDIKPPSEVLWLAVVPPDHRFPLNNEVCKWDDLPTFIEKGYIDVNPDVFIPVVRSIAEKLSSPPFCSVPYVSGSVSINLPGPWRIIGITPVNMNQSSFLVLALAGRNGDTAITVPGNYQFELNEKLILDPELSVITAAGANLPE